MMDAHRVIQLFEFGGNQGPRWPVLALRLLPFGADCSPGSLYKAVAIHTYAGGRNAGVAAGFRTKMTIKTTDLKLLGM